MATRSKKSNGIIMLVVGLLAGMVIASIKPVAQMIGKLTKGKLGQV